MPKNTTSENEVNLQKTKPKKHHRKTIPIAWGVAVIIILWAGYHHHHQQELKIASMNANIISMRQTVASLDARYTHDYANEGFLRRHLWKDSNDVENDRTMLLSAVGALNAEQQAECRVTGQKQCPVVQIDGYTGPKHGWSVLQKLGIVTGTGVTVVATWEVATAVNAAASAMAVGGLGTIGGSVIVTCGVVVLPVALIAGGLWWAFH